MVGRDVIFFEVNMAIFCRTFLDAHAIGGVASAVVTDGIARYDTKMLSLIDINTDKSVKFLLIVYGFGVG